MSYQNHSQKFPFDNSLQQGQPQAPTFQQVYHSQQHQMCGFEQQQFPSLNQNGYGYYVSPQSNIVIVCSVPQYYIPPQPPTPLDSISSNSISLNEEGTKKKKASKSDKSKKDKRKKRKRGFIVVLIIERQQQQFFFYSSRSHSKQKRKHFTFLHSEDNWKCKYCYNINFRHRSECNRCKKSREYAAKNEKTKRYVPNPDDWKCYSCGNFNFARRRMCNRCKKDKSSASIPQYSD
ncbi:unnamed protein product (macronuclear) [Paramecium tetraurelia]|uniref:RanBP2-type domain-containing protein n=1 Tax=Paramecium tetraurelia TaxID=5888 RepID=A0D0L9_PARTE|nr:uncharacterized protein GSPATT00012138001 [Paramecium tetraurelia]CAK76586.1 unnamed protein product [Paramecium tetraurelia]|eukprot:XP_001443983.1 hypothetical protein (macronuclear) [Paramecium tetraurelia strain d4-2]